MPPAQTLAEALSAKAFRVGDRVRVFGTTWTVELISAKAVSLGTSTDTLDLGYTRDGDVQVEWISQGTGPRRKLPARDIPTSLYD